MENSLENNLERKIADYKKLLVSNIIQLSLLLSFEIEYKKAAEISLRNNISVKHRTPAAIITQKSIMQRIEKILIKNIGKKLP